MKKVFPIDNDAACQYKWTWSTLFLNRATTASCHRGFHWKFDENTIGDFHNHKGKIGDRIKMLNNEWPGNGCEYCRDIEAVGGSSDRTSFANDHEGILPPELEIDPTATHVTPRLLEVYFKNTCNQSCVYCSPGFSSQIEQEVRKYGPSKHNWDYSNWVDDARDKYELLNAKFWEWMGKNAHELTLFRVLGGEPMYQEEFDQCLEFFDKNPCPNLTWSVFTNMNHRPEKFKEKIEKIKALIDNKKIKTMDFICSIDCWGPEVEFARYGLNLAEAEENMNLLVATEGISILIHSTLTALTLPTMYQLIEKVIEWRKRKHDHKIFIGWNTVVTPNCFDPYNFGPNFIQYIDKAIDTLSDSEIQDSKKYLKGIKTKMEASPVNIEGVNSFAGFMDDLDVRRNEDWKSKFPQIVELIERLRNENV